MKLEHNWRYKSIENLEKDYWGDVPQDQTGIIQRVYRLRKLPLDEFTIDDIRFLIIQHTGFPYILVLAIEFLKDNLYAEGNYYEGDLLSAVIAIKPDYWMPYQELWTEINHLINPKLNELLAFRPRLDIDNFFSVRFI